MTERDSDEQEQLSQITEGIWENIRRGFIEFVGNDPDGAPRFRITAAGIRHMEEMIASHGGGDE